MFGTKNVLKRINFKLNSKHLPFLFLACMICIDLLLFHMEYQNYKDKYDIIGNILEQRDWKTSANLAADLLKHHNPADSTNGTKWLTQNGYPLHYKNIYYSRYLTNITQISIISTLFYLFILFALHYLRKEETTKQKDFVYQLEQIFSNARSGNYNSLKQKSGLHSHESGRFFMELESFLSSYQRKEEQIQLEKEGVKSLVTDISHQLKNPFSALRTSFEILKRDDLEEEGRIEFFFRYEKQLAAMEQLLHTFIQISRMENGMVEIKRNQTCLFDTILEAVNRIYLRAEEKQIDIELEAEPELQEVEIPHDQKWLCETFLNILENSVKYSPSATKITIRLEKLITFFRVEIEDQGIGIPKEEYHKIFQRFYRGTETEVRIQPGSGIGLYLCREIVAKHNGTISVISSQEKKNTGSKFILQLPYKI